MNQVNEASLCENTLDERVLVLAPTSGDNALTNSILAQAAIPCRPCVNLNQLIDQLAESVGAVLLTDDILQGGKVSLLVEALKSQPPWSDLPIILLSATGDQSPLSAWMLEQLGNVTILERPVRVTTLISALRSALRARRRQYQLRDQLNALRESESRYRQLADLLPTAVYSCDATGLITFYNQRAAQLWGREPRLGDTDERFCGSDQMILPDGTPLPHEKCPMAVALGEGRSFRDAAVNIRRPDGSIIPVLVNIDPIRNEQGEIVGAINAFHDISEIKRAEQALRESEQRFRMLADNMAPLAWTCDQLGNSTWYNQRWFDYTGFSFEEMRGSGWIKCHHPDHLERIVASVNHSRETGEPWEETFPLRGKDGRYRWFLSRAIPIRDAEGKIVCWFGTNTDVDDQLRAEEALRNNEARLANEAAALVRLNELSSQLWRSSSLQDGLDTMLDAAIELLGAGMGNVQLLDTDRGVLRIAAQRGFSEDFLEFVREVSAEDDLACGRALRVGERIMIEDIETDPRYQAYRPIARAAGYHAVQSTPLIGRDGAPLGILSTYYDQPHLPGEQDLHRLDLFARQAADFIERCRSDETLREADRRKDEFLAMLAHELRNPLAPIRTGLQILQLNNENPDGTADTLHMMDRQLRQLVRLIDDLLDISRITRGKIELRRERCDLATILSMAIEGSRPTIEAAGVELSVTTPRRDVELDADPVRLSQIFSNLLTNAAKYTDRGGHIWLTVERQESEVLVAVRDNGIGIRPEMLPRIFEMFTQVDKSERSGGGLGIGLSLVRGLVEMHGGTVEAHSDGPGQGSQFIVRLPVTDYVERTPQGDSNTSAESSKGRRVLVVDDNRDAAKCLSLLLRTMGNEVQTAYDGLEAVAVTETFRPDILLLDLGMPNVNGYEAAARIRQEPWGQDITIVALTGWGQDEDRRRTKDAGFDAHLVKPVDCDALVEVLTSGKSETAREP